MFVVLLALFPQGTAILKQYVLLLLWLQLWPPLYVMVNYICSVCAKSYMLGANLSLQFLSKLLQVNSDVIALAGYLSLITSVLTAILMSGIVTMFVQWFKQEVTLTNAAATVEAPPTGLNNNVSMFSSQNHQL
jgi:conjugal transfer mating pair stabilization protein TraG